MAKGSKGLNPADAYRKEQKKKDAKKQKIHKAKTREIQSLMNNPSRIEEEIRKVQRESDSNKLDKGLKDRVRELKAMHVVAMRKVHNRDDAMGLTSSTDTSAAEVEKHAPEESVYYHPTFNPTGAPPPGQPPKYRSSVPPPAPPPTLPPASMQTIYGPSATPRPPTPQYYAPPPPPPYAPRQVEIGGRHGVPLPPPRPPQQQRHQLQQVDPLNPAAPGYTQRFGGQQKVRASADDVVQYPAPRPASYTPSTITAAPTVPPEIVPIASPPTAAQPEHEVSAPSIADIMRRRHLIQDAEAGPAMPAPEAGPSLPDPDEYYPAPGPQMPSNDLYGSSFEAPAPMPKAPKVIKADAELVSLVPAALRVKRANNTQQPKPKIRRVEDTLDSNSFTEEKTVVPPQAAASSVDDAYAAFMSEIQELGAFE